MSNSKNTADQKFEIVDKALSHLVEVPAPDGESWERGRAAFLTRARQLKPEPVSQTSPARLKGWTAGFINLLSTKIPARKEINMTGLATILITVSAIFALAIGGVDAAQSSLPGTPFYPLKTTWETVQLSLAASPDTLAERALVNANSRVQEAQKLAQSGLQIPPELPQQYRSSLQTALQAASGLDEPLRSQLMTKLQTQLGLHQQLLNQAKTQTQNQTSATQNQLALMLKTMEQVREQVRLRINQQETNPSPEGDQNQIQNQNQNQNQSQNQNQNSNQGQETLQNQFQFQYRETEQSQESNSNQQQNQEKDKGQDGAGNQNSGSDENSNKGGGSSGGN